MSVKSLFQLDAQMDWALCNEWMLQAPDSLNLPLMWCTFVPCSGFMFVHRADTSALQTGRRSSVMNGSSRHLTACTFHSKNEVPLPHLWWRYQHNRSLESSVLLFSHIGTSNITELLPLHHAWWRGESPETLLVPIWLNKRTDLSELLVYRCLH